MYRNDRALPDLIERTKAILHRRLGTRDWTLTTATRDLPPAIVALVLTLPALAYLVRAGHPREYARESATTIPGVVYVNVDTQQLQYIHDVQHIAGLVAEQLMLQARDHGALPGYGGNPEREGGNFA